MGWAQEAPGGGEMNEERICPVHGRQMEVRASGHYCQHCERMGRHGQVIVPACSNPKCRAILLGIEPLIKGQPSIRIGWRYAKENLRDEKPHDLYVSPLWGDHTSFPGLGDSVQDGEVLDLFCPFCRQAFPTVAYCECLAKVARIPTLYMNDGQDGFVEVCSRRGCPYHRKGRPDERREALVAAAGLRFMCGAPEPDEPIRGANGTM